MEHKGITLTFRCEWCNADFHEFVTFADPSSIRIYRPRDELMLRVYKSDNYLEYDDYPLDIVARSLGRNLWEAGIDCPACGSRVNLLTYAFNLLPLVGEVVRKCSICSTYYPLDAQHFRHNSWGEIINGACFTCRPQAPPKVRNYSRGTMLKHMRRRRCQLPKAVVNLLFRWQKGRCWWCDTDLNGKYFEVDHRIPIARGGTNELGNLVISCRECNRSKSDSYSWTWNGRLL
jgi:5-methylcytosine-specific restriction endonuclease McrA